MRQLSSTFGASVMEMYLKRSILVLGIIALLLIVLTVRFQNIADVNAADLAQVARHVARGEGFTTSVLTPLELALVPSIDKHPDIAHPPLQIVALAVALLVGGSSDRAVALTSIFFFVATLLLVYLIARRCFSDHVGIFAMLLCLVCVPLLDQAVSGLETCLLGFLVTLLFGLMLLRERSDVPEHRRWPLAMGIVAGLCYLTRFEAFILLLVVLFYWWRSEPKRCGRPMLLVAIPFLILVMPWIIRNSIIARGPFISLQSYELIMRTDFYPAQTLYRTYRNVPHIPVIEAFRQNTDMFKKMNQGVIAFYSNITQLPNPFVMPFFVAGLVLGSIRRRHALTQWCLALSLLLYGMVIGLYMPLPRLVMPYAPLIALLATVWLSQLVEEYLQDRVESIRAFGSRLRFLGRRGSLNYDDLQARLRYIALLAWVFIASYPLLNLLFVTPAVSEHPVVATCKALQQQPAHLIATDLPTMVAWYGDKTALLLPQNDLELGALTDANLGPDGLYLSPSLMREGDEERLEFWKRTLMSGKDFEDFTFVKDWKRPGALWLRKTPPSAPSSTAGTI